MALSSGLLADQFGVISSLKSLRQHIMGTESQAKAASPYNPNHQIIRESVDKRLLSLGETNEKWDFQQMKELIGMTRILLNHEVQSRRENGHDKPLLHKRRGEEMFGDRSGKGVIVKLAEYENIEASVMALLYRGKRREISPTGSGSNETLEVSRLCTEIIMIKKNAGSCLSRFKGKYEKKIDSQEGHKLSVEQIKDVLHEIEVSSAEWDIFLHSYIDRLFEIDFRKVLVAVQSSDEFYLVFLQYLCSRLGIEPPLVKDVLTLEEDEELVHEDLPMHREIMELEVEAMILRCKAVARLSKNEEGLLTPSGQNLFRETFGQLKQVAEDVEVVLKIMRKEISEAALLMAGQRNQTKRLHYMECLTGAFRPCQVIMTEIQAFEVAYEEAYSVSYYEGQKSSPTGIAKKLIEDRKLTEKLKMLQLNVDNFKNISPKTSFDDLSHGNKVARSVSPARIELQLAETKDMRTGS